jgi:hypothetical protein
VKGGDRFKMLKQGLEKFGERERERERGQTDCCSDRMIEGTFKEDMANCGGL